MAQSERYEFRLSAVEREKLRAVATRAQRSEADVLRYCIRALDLNAITGGIPAPSRLTGGNLAGAEALREREVTAA